MTIPINRKRFPIALFIGILGVILLLSQFIPFQKYYDGSGIEKSIYQGVILGGIISCLLLIVLTAADYFKTIFDKRASLTVTKEKVNDNLSIFSVGDIFWADVTDLKIVRMFNTDMLVVGVTNPQSFINRKPMALRRPLKGFLKRFGSPVVISQKRIDYNLSELKDVMTEYLYK